MDCSDKSCLQNQTHCRYNPLEDSWVLVCPHRTQRPWHGETLDTKTDREKCMLTCGKEPEGNYLAPMQKRSTGQVNPDYKETFAFDNDFPALTIDDSHTPRYSSPTPKEAFGSFKSVSGKCRVLCLNPDQSISWPEMTPQQAYIAINFIRDEYCALENSGKFKWIQIFENRGAAMGCSNSHPHCQIWATDFMPDLPLRRNENLLKYYKTHSSPMMRDYAKWEESTNQERVVCTNDQWICVVPFWAVWPFETMIMQTSEATHCASIADLNDSQVRLLGSIVQEVVTKYDLLFDCKFPYSMGFYSAPCMNKGDERAAWSIFISFLPPLLRSASVRKYMVGFELFAQPQRDVSAETAAERLRHA